MDTSGDPRPEPSRAASASQESRRRLDSWKEIASYLGRSEKTVRRWEEGEGLPVHRLHHEKRGSVYAYAGELDAWREARRAATKGEPLSGNNASKLDTPEILVAGPELEGKRTNLLDPRRRRWLIAVVISAAISLIGLLAGMRWIRLRELVGRGPSTVRIQSLAVLPFENLSSDTEQEYFAIGVTEQLITELAKITSVRVISRTSVMRYKNTTKSLREIAQELNVDAVIEGAVMRSGSRVRMTVQLITPSPEHHLWADTYEGDIRDVLTLQRDAAHDIGTRIQTKLATRADVRSGANKRLDPETYEDYLRGRYFLARRNGEAINKALAYFNKAVQRDPQYAQAYAGLAVTYDVVGMYHFLPPDASFARVKGFANKALALDNTLSEAYTARALAASFWEFDWAAADKDFQRAIELDPNSALAHHWFGEHFIAVGKAERAVAELKRARELDPLSLPVNSALGRVYRDAGLFDEALLQCNKTVELDPNFSMGHWCLGQTYLGERNYSAAIPELERASALGTTPLLICDLGFAYAAAGRSIGARAILEAFQRKAQFEYIPPYLIAAIYGALGEKDEAFKWLDRAYNERDSHITYLKLDPEMDPLRSDPRFGILMQRLKLPE
jgi:TolB-like protein/Tfp pilus assembly protein PilF